MDEKIKKRALAASLARTGSSLLKTVHVSVNWLQNDEDLGYTSMGSATSCSVFVSWYMKELYEELDEAERDALRTGVFAHEILHQLLTEFQYTNLVTKGMSQAEAGIFMQFANTIEDPAIEYFAPQCFGGRLLDSLRFSIRHIYQKSPGIDKSGNPFSQLINALINFGDMGIVKGSWTFPEAKEAFIKVAPIYNAAIVCPDGKKRIDYAKECMEATRALWEPLVERQKSLEEIMKAFDEFLKRLKNSGRPLKKPEELNPDDDSSKSDVSEKRDKLVAKLAGSDKSDGDKKDGEKAEKGSGKASDKKDEDANKDQGDENLGSASDDLSSLSDPSGSKEVEKEGSKSKMKGNSNPGDNSRTKPSSSENEEEGSQPTPGESEDPVEDATKPEEEANSLASDSYEVDDSLLDSIEESIKSETRKLEQQDKKENSDGTDKIEDFDITSKSFKSHSGHASCINRRVSDKATAGRMSELYAEALNEYSYEIKNLTKTLDKLFKADRESTVAATSGEYNIVRGTLGTTARIFDKRRDPDKLKDAAVVLLVDLSGSMSGSKEAQAKKTAICLAEALTKCRIPYYVMGFHADMGADAVHDHFVTWSNRKVDRESIISMRAYGNNFDGYSIRYAGEVLKKRQEDNKILFVISDGQPACSSYRGSAGISDTIDAIKSVRKTATVFGIAVGRSCGPELLQSMYGKDFIFVEDEKLLINMLGKKLIKMLKVKK